MYGETAVSNAAKDNNLSGASTKFVVAVVTRYVTITALGFSNGFLGWAHEVEKGGQPPVEMGE